jgi:rfaE bifunctional protein kinase chain/domain
MGKPVIGNELIHNLQNCHVLVVGDVMLDRYLWGEVNRISPEAPVPVIHVRRRSMVPGGAGNVVLNIIGLGAAVALIGVCGNDQNGKHLKRLLKDKNIRQRLVTVSELPTITKTRILSKGQQLLRIDEEEALPMAKGVAEKLLDHVNGQLSECQAVVLSDYGKGIFHTTGITEEIIPQCN